MAHGNAEAGEPRDDRGGCVETERANRDGAAITQGQAERLSGIFKTLVCPPESWNTKICSLWLGPLTMASRSFLPFASSDAGTPTWWTSWSMR